MSEESKTVEHHWHDPTQGQVHKAMYQFLADGGFTVEKLMAVVDKKLEDAIRRKVNEVAHSPDFDRKLLAAVVHAMDSEKKTFDATSYGFANRLRDLVQQELQRTVLKEYKVNVVKRDQPS